MAQLLADLNSATFWINRLSPIISIGFGTIGNLFNIIIFTRRPLRTNPCSMYFLASSIANCVVMYVALLTRYLATSWNIDPSATNTYWCKIRFLLIYPALSLALWFIVLASIDRYLTSSDQIRYRQWSSIRIARKTILVTTIVTFILNIHVLVFARAEVIDGTAICTILPNEYLVFFNLFVPIISCILPVVLMSAFGILTIINIRRVRHRVAPQDNHVQNERLRSNDRQLVIMLLVQVLITTIIVAPWSLTNMFSAIAVAILKYKFSPTGQAIYNFAFNLSRMLYYVNPAIGFYIYTLTGPRFRVEIKHTIVAVVKFILETTGLWRCCPLRMRRIVVNDISMTSNLR